MKHQWITKILSALMIVMLALAVLPVTSAYAAACTFTSNATGTWTTAGTWSAVGTACSTYPGQTFSGDTVIISNGHTVTLNVSPAQTIASLQVGQGTSGTLTLGDDNQNRTLGITGNVTVSSGGTFNTAGNGGNLLNIGGDLTNNGTFDMDIGGAEAAVNFNGTAVQTISGTGATLEFSDATVISNTTAVVTTTRNFTISDGTMTVNNGATFNVGTFVISNGTENGAFVLATGGTLWIGSTAGITTGVATGNIQTNNRNFSAGANYVYSGTANQNTGNGFPNNLTGSLTINNPVNTVTLSNGRTISSGGTLNLVAGTFASGTNLTMNTTSTINRSEGSITGTLQGNGRYNVNYTGNSKTTGIELSVSGNTTQGLNNVTVNLNAGQTLTLDQNRTLDGNLTLTSGILDLNTFTLNRSAAGGTFSMAAGTSLLVSGANNFPASYNTVTLNATSTVNYDAAGNQTISARPYGNLILSGSGSKSISTGTSIAGNIEITSTAQSNIGAGLSIPANSLSFNNIGQVSGSWGSTTSPATNTNNTFFTATTGILNVATNTAPLIPPTLSITNLPVTYNGSPQAATVTCSSGGAVSNILYDGSPTIPTNASTYAVTADCAAVTGYTSLTNASAGDFVIDPATPTITVTNGPVDYDGFPHAATVSCLGGGIASNIQTGGAATQTNAGTYAVTADCAASTNYTAATGLAAGDFVINIIGQTINVTTNAPVSASNGSTFDVAATATSGLPVTITTSGSCSGGDTDGDAAITMTSGTGTCSVFYDQAGNSNYSAAPQVQEDVNASEGPSFTSANNISFDMGFPGSFMVTAVGNPSTMAITSTGTLPAGVTFTDNGDGTAQLAGTPAAGTNGTYALEFAADNGVLPNATQSFTLTVRNGPIVDPNGINSVPDTGDGSVSENESIIDTLGITQLTVEFDQDVYDPAGDTDPHDVTNPVNYILARSTSTSFATGSCALGVTAPDVAISVDSVTYNNGGGSGPFIATLSINGGFPLNVVGFYRLYACGTTSIVDAVNTDLNLAGNGNTPGTDFQRNFRIARVVTGGGGGGGGGGSGSGGSGSGGGGVNASPVVTSGFFIPVTGFAPNQVTVLPAQPEEKTYASMGKMTIEIPTLGIKFPIVGASINNKTWDLTWLNNNVAYLEGSAYPTLPGNTVLTAHVQDANKNLGPFSDIKGMQVGQKIYIHVNGFTYVYQVQESQKILPTSVSRVFKHEEEDWLTLVTCEDYNAKTGSYTMRRMVRAVLISVIPAKK